MDKDEKFNYSPGKNPTMIRKGGIHVNSAKGGIEIAFNVGLTEYTLLITGEERKFEKLSDEIIQKIVKTMHTDNRWLCLLKYFDVERPL